ncbi:hypothetical protein QVL82_15770, partial [Cellulosimicrobium funkei]|uniref:hypothetical protein n=1 Tax=Cellulosimicrobium funkei TaxID=264251 RepID=UPI00375727F4
YYVQCIGGLGYLYMCLACPGAVPGGRLGERAARELLDALDAPVPDPQDRHDQQDRPDPQDPHDEGRA